MKKILAVMTVIVALCLVGGPAFAGWTVVSLHPAGATYSYAYGISGGRQAGCAYFGDNYYHAGLWSGTAESWVDLHPAGPDGSCVQGVSEDQQVGEADSSGTPHASLWSGTAESWVDLHPLGAIYSYATGVSDGQQVGEVNFGDGYHATLWSGTADNWVDLHPLGAYYSYANGISDGRQVGVVDNHAGLWSGTAESWADLHPAGAQDSTAYGISDGQQVGEADFYGYSHAGLWSGTAESWVDLNPAGAQESAAYGISSGQQVGYAYYGNEGCHAGLWSGTAASWVDLHALLPAGVYDQSFAGSVEVSGGDIWVAGWADDKAMLWHYIPDGPPISIPDAKLRSDSPTATFSLSGKVVTAAGADFFYIEEDSRSMGIRVEKTAHGLSAGMRADVTGTIKTKTNGDRCIVASSATQTPAPNDSGNISPIAMNNKTLGGGDWHYDSDTGAGQRGVTGGAGLNNIGLLVRTTGSCTYVDDHTFTIDDGSGVSVTCETPSTMLVNPAWQYVAVTGISTIRKTGETYERKLGVGGIDPIVSQPSEGITGRWEMTNTSGDMAGVFGMLLVQQGSGVTGSARGCTFTDGQMSGDTFTGTFVVDADTTVDSELTLSGDTLTGTWSDADGAWVFPVTFERVSPDPMSPYVGQPKVLAASCDGSTINVTWDRPVNGWDYDIRRSDGESIADWEDTNVSYDPATHVYSIPLSTWTPLVPGEQYTIYLDSGDNVNWHDPYGAPAWDTGADCYSFEYTIPLQLSVISAFPPGGPNTGELQITDLSGSDFAEGATVKLTRDGQPDIPGTGVTVQSTTMITCDFDLTGAATGLWSITVTNPDSRSSTLDNGFAILLPDTSAIVGCANKSITDVALLMASKSFRIKAWGKVTIINDFSFQLDDGSGNPATVYSPFYSGISDGDYASGMGTLNSTVGPLVLLCYPSDVINLAVPTPPQVHTGPLAITWDPKLFNHGQNVYELQVIRDQGAYPVRTIRDPSQWNIGYTDLKNLYGTGSGTLVSFYMMDPGATWPTMATWTVPAEGYGITHQYQLRALLRVQTGVDGAGNPVYEYTFTQFGNVFTATAVEPVAADHIISPLNGDPLLVSELLSGDVNLRWTSAAGADQFRVSVWPVQPGTGPTWQSSVINYGSGTEVSLPDADRLALASLLSPSFYVDKEMFWRVDGRHVGDTSLAWTQGDTVVFRIGSEGPPPPPF